MIEKLKYYYKRIYDADTTVLFFSRRKITITDLMGSKVHSTHDIAI